MLSSIGTGGDGRAGGGHPFPIPFQPPVCNNGGDVVVASFAAATAIQFGGHRMQFGLR